jgi:hypothetical protein
MFAALRADRQGDPAKDGGGRKSCGHARRQTPSKNHNEAGKPNEGELNEGALNKVVGGTTVVQLAKDAAKAGAKGAADAAVKGTSSLFP